MDVSAKSETWEVIDAPNVDGFNNILTGVAAISPNDIWAVGHHSSPTSSKALALHWDGKSWTPIPTLPQSNRDQLFGVAAISSNDVWAVGRSLDNSNRPRALAMHWDGSSWKLAATPQMPPGQVAQLIGVAGATPKQVWAVGWTGGDGNTYETALVLQWNGSEWKLMPTPSEAGTQLRGVATHSSGNAWAVGSRSASDVLILSWNGSQWKLDQVPSFGQTAIMQGVATVTAEQPWAAGQLYRIVQGQGNKSTKMIVDPEIADPNALGSATLVLHEESNNWKQVESPNVGGAAFNDLYSIAPVTDDHVWAVGRSGNNASDYKALALQYKKKQWQITELPPQLQGGVSQLRGVSIARGPKNAPSTTAWAVGHFMRDGKAHTLIMRYMMM